MPSNTFSGHRYTQFRPRIRCRLWLLLCIHHNKSHNWIYQSLACISLPTSGNVFIMFPGVRTVRPNIRPASSNSFRCSGFIYDASQGYLRTGICTNNLDTESGGNCGFCYAYIFPGVGMIYQPLACISHCGFCYAYIFPGVDTCADPPPCARINWGPGGISSGMIARQTHGIDPSHRCQPRRVLAKSIIFNTKSTIFRGKSKYFNRKSTPCSLMKWIFHVDLNVVESTRPRLARVSSIIWVRRMVNLQSFVRSINRRHVYTIWERDLSIAGMYIQYRNASPMHHTRSRSTLLFHPLSEQPDTFIER